MSTLNFPHHYSKPQTERQLTRSRRLCSLSWLSLWLLVLLRLLLWLLLLLLSCCLALFRVLSRFFHPRINFPFVSIRSSIRTPHSGQVVGEPLWACVLGVVGSTRRWYTVVLHCARWLGVEISCMRRHVWLPIWNIVSVICIAGEVILKHSRVVIKRGFVHVSVAEIYFIPPSMCHIMITQIISTIDLLSGHVTRYPPISEAIQTSFNSKDLKRTEKKNFLRLRQKWGLCNEKIINLVQGNIFRINYPSSDYHKLAKERTRHGTRGQLTVLCKAENDHHNGGHGSSVPNTTSKEPSDLSSFLNWVTGFNSLGLNFDFKLFKGLLSLIDHCRFLLWLIHYWDFF